jgi:transposase-like protein
MSVLDAPHFRDDTAARELLERLRWPDGPVCPHCGSIGRAYSNKAKPGVSRCAEKECAKDFTVITNTAMGASHIPLHKWMIGFYLMNSSKKGVSAKQLERTLLITYRSAWFMAHRIREAMKDGGMGGPLGSGGGIVEVDETAFGKLEGAPNRFLHRGASRRKPYGPNYTNTVLTLVERGGSSRTFHVDGRASADLMPILRAHVAPDARVMTDEWPGYFDAAKHFASHEAVKHSAKEYVRGDVHTNTVEGYFSVFKRGMKGVYQHCGEKHLHRYLAEFNFRYSHRSALGYTDVQRTVVALKRIGGRRLMYRQPVEYPVPF